MMVETEYGTGCGVSTKGDIYSYGILVLEMVTGRRPTDAMFGEGLSLHTFCEMAIPEGITEIVDSRLLVAPVEEGRRMWYWSCGSNGHKRCGTGAALNQTEALSLSH